MNAKALLAVVLIAYGFGMAYLFGQASFAELALDGYHAGDQARALLVRCVDAAAEARIATLSWSGDLREVLVHLDRVPPVPLVESVAASPAER